MEELGDFRRRLESHFPRLTKSEQQIASYLLTNHDEAAFVPAAELAKRLDVSEATIVRFAKAVGYDSFPELRRVLQEIFRARVTPASRLQRKLADLKSGEGHVLSKIIDMELQYLAEAQHSIDPATFDRAVEVLVGGERVFVFGIGPSRILADLVQIRLRRFGVPTFSLIESGRDLLEKLLLLKPDDAVLATGFHRVTGELVAVIDHAHRLGCRTVLLTDTLGPTFKGKVDVILSARRGPVSNFHSLTVPMTIINALILAVAMSRSEDSLTSLKHLQELRAAYGLDVTGKLNS
ncbi:MAG: MurR/RpiR family transcriptional regulator [Chloroflexota bacterium]|nr:MurR/RpiR family transcriptional regulator [Chloroflexota bacterium]